MSAYKSDRKSFCIEKELDKPLKELAELHGITVSMMIKKLCIDSMIKNKEHLSHNEKLEQLARARRL